MKFPRVHVFVDSNCPALLSGKISSWVAPSKLVAMLSPKNTQFSPSFVLISVSLYTMGRSMRVSEKRLRLDSKMAVLTSS